MASKRLTKSERNAIRSARREARFIDEPHLVNRNVRRVSR